MIFGRPYYSSIYNALATEAERLQALLRELPAESNDAASVSMQIAKISGFMGDLARDMTPSLLADLQRAAADLYPQTDDTAPIRQELIDKLEAIRGILAQDTVAMEKVTPGTTMPLQYMITDTHNTPNLTHEDDAYKDVARGIVTINGENLCHLTQLEFEQKIQNLLGIVGGIDAADAKQQALYDFIILNAQRLLVPFMQDISTSVLYEGKNLNSVDSGANTIDWQIDESGIYCTLRSETKCLMGSEDMLVINEAGAIDVVEMSDPGQFAESRPLIRQKCRFELIAGNVPESEQMSAQLSLQQYQVDHHPGIQYSPEHQRKTDNKLRDLVAELLLLKGSQYPALQDLAIQIEGKLAAGDEMMRGKLKDIKGMVYDQKKSVDRHSPEFEILAQAHLYLDQLYELALTRSEALLGEGFSLIKDAPYAKLNALLFSVKNSQDTSDPDIVDIRTLSPLLANDQREAMRHGINQQLKNIDKNIMALMYEHEGIVLKKYDHDAGAVVVDLEKLKNDIKIAVSYMGKYLDNTQSGEDDSDSKKMIDTKNKLAILACDCEDKIQQYSEVAKKPTAKPVNIFVKIFRAIFGESGVLARLKNWFFPSAEPQAQREEKKRRVHLADDTVLHKMKKPKIPTPSAVSVGQSTEPLDWKLSDEGKHVLTLSTVLPAKQTTFKEARQKTRDLDGGWVYDKDKANYIADFSEKGIVIEAVLKHGPVGLQNKLEVSIKCAEDKKSEALDLTARVFPALAKTIEPHLDEPRQGSSLGR